MESKHGNWHIQIENISQNILDKIRRRSDVQAVGTASVFNFDGDEPYSINTKKLFYMVQIKLI